MDENRIRLLMETTGCNRYEAELASKSARGDFVEALNFLHNAMARLEIIRGKFAVHGKFIYGAFLLISDIKKGMPLAASAVLSKNPSIYEINISAPWEDIEKYIYSARLAVGSLPELSGIIQEKFSQIMWMLCSEPSLDIEEKIKETLAEVLETNNIRIHIERSEEPYKTPPSLSFAAQYAASHPPTDDSSYYNGIDGKQPVRSVGIVLDVEPLKLIREGGGHPSYISKGDNSDFVMASEIMPGDAIWIKISDTREVALYLAERLGALKDNRILPIVCEVVSVKSVAEEVFLKIKFAENVSGLCRVYSGDKIKTLVPRQKGGNPLNISRLWKKIFKKIGARR